MGTYVCICIAIEENILTISIGTYICGVLVNDHSSSFEVVVFTPHLVSSTAGKILFIYTCRLAAAVHLSGVPFGPAKGPFKRANVGPASKDSTVNNIALKTATLVLHFS